MILDKKKENATTYIRVSKQSVNGKYVEGVRIAGNWFRDLGYKFGDILLVKANKNKIIMKRVKE